MTNSESKELTTNVKICSCPECRFARGEITSSEYAWYLKGKIEARSADLYCKEHGIYGEDNSLFKNYESNLKSNRMDDECLLTELLNSDRKPEKTDQAWLEPRNYVMEKRI